MTPMDEESRVRCIRAFESLARPVADMQTIHNLLAHGDAADITRIRIGISVLKDWIVRLDVAAENLK